MGDSQRFALENSPQIAKIIATHQNFRRYCRKAILYPICTINVFDMYDNHYNDDTVRMRSFRDMENWETMFFHRVTKCI